MLLYWFSIDHIILANSIAFHDNGRIKRYKEESDE